MRVLGISAFYHDSAAALIEDGRIVAAAQEERFTRRKHDSAYPRHAIDFCLRQAYCRLGDVDLVAFYEKPFLKFERLFETYLAFAPKGFSSFRKAMPLWFRTKLFQKQILIDHLKENEPKFPWASRLLFSEHHLSHAASAYFPSPFEEAAVLTMDGVGEWATTSLGHGKGDTLSLTREIHFPHSLGLLYSAFTYYLGFKVNSGEYKVMGLAPYGEPRFVKQIFENLLDLKPDGSFRLNQEYFDYCTGLRMTNSRFDRLFEGPARRSDEPLTQKHMDLAASIQKATEEVVLTLTRAIASDTGSKNLCLAGGVALNCVANGKVLREGRFDRIWVQPAAGDAGGALGAALAVYHDLSRTRIPREAKSADSRDQMSGSYLGPEFDQEEIERQLRLEGAKFEVLSDEKLLEKSAEALASGKALGWFQGRMEFGPRALGGRSILADARSPDAQTTLNLKVKYRESFRPFAPAVLAEEASDWFELSTESPYMLMVADVRKEHRKAPPPGAEKLFGIEKLKLLRSEIPAVTHVDYSARIQTVHRETNPRFHGLLTEFKGQTGCPVVVNTSFNVRGEPIVCTPKDAFRCFMGTEIEALAIGNCFLEKRQQDASLKLDYKSGFELD